MDAFAHLSVLFSIVLGLAITQILNGIRGLVQTRGQVRHYWPCEGWALLSLVMCVQSWWAMFGLRTHEHWTFAQFSIVLLQLIFTYLLSGVVLPDIVPSSEPDAPALDLREHYFRYRRLQFVLAVGILAASLAKALVMNGELPEPADLWGHVVFGIAWGIAAITRNETYHKLLLPVTALGILFYIAILFMQLR